MARLMPDEKDHTASLAFFLEETPKPRVLVFCGEKLATYELPESGSLTVGRTKECDIQIDHRSVSRQHARLHVGSAIKVEDLGSSNGTRLAGHRLKPRHPEPLAPGAIVELGLATLVVRGTLPESPSAGVERAIVAGDFTGRSRDEHGSTMDRVRRLANLVAEGRLGVILLGETGVGKELMAEAIHAQSPRRSKPLVRINCAALPEQLLESELFGFERGAFSGAAQAKPGFLEAADGGTLFLDEVGELPLVTQAKLLRVVEGNEVTRLGALQPRTVDVRFLAATNRDLPELVRAGTFRRDLYHRLNGITLAIPPLRERVEEIAALAAGFVAEACARLGRPNLPVLPATVAWLNSQPWPGNVRELRNTMERAVMLSEGAPIAPAHVAGDLAPAPSREPPPAQDLRSELDSLERARIEEALLRSGGNQTRAAALLGISRRTLIGRLEAYKLPRPRRS